MDIILNEDVKNLGYKNDLVSVKPGYGRNFLIPKGLGKLATESAKKSLKETVKQRAFKEQKIKSAAEESAAKLAEMTVKVSAKAGESGKIFGSVTTVQIADALRSLGVEVDRKNISMGEDAIKTLGTYEVGIRLHKDIAVKVKFEVVEG